MEEINEVSIPEVKKSPWEVAMNQSILSVSTVSDGVIVTFRDGFKGYFSADFLLNHLGSGSNQLFLDYDPTPQETAGSLSIRPSVSH